MPMAFKPRWGRPQTPMLLNDTENSSCVVGCKFMLIFRNRCRKNVCHRLSVLPVSFGFGRNRPVVASTNRVKNGFHSVSPLWVISPVCSTLLQGQLNECGEVPAISSTVVLGCESGPSRGFFRRQEQPKTNGESCPLWVISAH